MTDTIFHVYDSENRVVAHSLSNDSLTEKVLRDEIDPWNHEIVELKSEKYPEASY